MAGLAQSDGSEETLWVDGSTSLFEAGEYALCGPYLDANDSYRRIVDNRTLFRSMNFSVPEHDAMDEMFSKQVAGLVTALVVNRHPSEAEHVANEASQLVNNPQFAAMLAKAKNTKVPPRWPDGPTAWMLYVAGAVTALGILMAVVFLRRRQRAKQESCSLPA